MKKLNNIFFILRDHFELIFWVMGLVLLFFLPMHPTEESLCIFKGMGFSSCPGCGIGHAIRAALHFRLIDSFHYHPLGIIAVIIIFNRIKQLLPKLKQNHETKSY